MVDPDRYTTMHGFADENYVLDNFIPSYSFSDSLENSFEREFDVTTPRKETTSKTEKSLKIPPLAGDRGNRQTDTDKTPTPAAGKSKNQISTLPQASQTDLHMPINSLLTHHSLITLRSPKVEILNDSEPNCCTICKQRSNSHTAENCRLRKKRKRSQTMEAIIGPPEKKQRRWY